MGRTIYKVLTSEQWAAAQTGALIQAPIDMQDGYVHFSTAEQLQDTLSKWFKGQSGCVLAAFDADAFGSSLRWEPARGSDLFPHVYSDVRAAQVRSLWRLEMGRDGAPVAPQEVVSAAGAAGGR